MYLLVPLIVQICLPEGWSRNSPQASISRKVHAHLLALKRHDLPELFSAFPRETKKKRVTQSVICTGKPTVQRLRICTTELSSNIKNGRKSCAETNKYKQSFNTEYSISTPSDSIRLENNISDSKYNIYDPGYLSESSIYVHWPYSPYCRQLCSYCNFVKFVPTPGKSWTLDEDLIIDTMVSIFFLRIIAVYTYFPFEISRW